MASRRPSPASRRVFALKRTDGEPLTRADIQYDFLHAIFGDTHTVFTDPYPTNAAQPSDKLCFRDLYIKSIFHSPKATKALKDKMTESSVFSLDFAMLSLLVNVGRINTTMSFFPEMKTAIRTYHPIPSLQHTNGNMLDAPRIKHILKTSLLDSEGKHTPTTPGDIIARSVRLFFSRLVLGCQGLTATCPLLQKNGQTPSTSVTNLIFVLAHQTTSVGQSYFQGHSDFLDLFLRTDISSVSRAQAFLWLCYNYLESPSSEDDYDDQSTSNPFSDSTKKFSPPAFTFLTDEEIALENQELPDDVAMAEKLISQRNRIVQTHGAKESAKAPNKASASGSVVGDDDEQLLPAADEVKNKPSAPVRRSAKTEKKLPKIKVQVRTSKAISDVEDESDDQLADAFFKHRTKSRHQSHLNPQHEQPTTDRYLLQESQRQAMNSDRISRRHRYSPYGQNYSHFPSKDGHRSQLRQQSTTNHVRQPRSLLEQAWHDISSTDALVDSGEEEGGDEYTRADYVQRLKVINRLSRQQWTNEQSSYPQEMDTDLNY